VFLIVASGDDDAAQAAYAAELARHLPKSEADVDALLATGVAKGIDTNFYFLCSVVNGHAAR
jgi:uncharacterized protein (UPF0261 family)